MTIKELYEWAKTNNCTDYVISVECYDEYGRKQEVWVDGDYFLKKRNVAVDVLIKCAD